MNQNFMNELAAEKKYYEQLVKFTGNRLKNAPQGTLRILMAKGKYPQSYYVGPESNPKYPNGIYIKKSEQALAQSLAQKEYDQKILKMAGSRLKKINELEKEYRESITHVYEGMSEARKALVSPVELTEEEFLREWYETRKGQENSYPIDGNLFSDRGEHVRSKSEKILADKLFREGIPYVYEPSLTLENGVTVFPDFAILNLRLRKEYFYEHFGMMDNSEYALKAVRKIASYRRNGYEIGENLLCTFEAKDELPDTKYYHRMIVRYLI